MTSQEEYPAVEELHPVVLVHDLQDKSSTPAPPLEERALLDACERAPSEGDGEGDGEGEGEETQFDSDTAEFTLPLNPDYKRQTLDLPAPPELTEHSLEQTDCEVSAPVYRNGLVFRENAPDINTQL